jgi:hypothetical protein
MESPSPSGEEEELPEPLSSPRNDPSVYKRSHFKYTTKTFGHSYYAKVSLNQRQFGHKKYSFYTTKSHHDSSTRAQVQSLPREYVNLSSGLRPPSATAMPTRQILGVFVAICAIIGAAIQSYHTPKSDLQPVASAREIVSGEIHSLTELLRRPYFTRALILKGIETLGEVLAQESAAEGALEAIRNESFVQTLWGFLASESSACEAPASMSVIVLGLNLLRDISLSGEETVVDRRAAARIFGRCYEIQDISATLSQLLIRATRTKAGLESLDGIAKPLVGSAVGDEFGPWALQLWRFLAVWSNLGKLGKDDMKSVCQFFEFAIQNKASWKRDHYATMCLLAEGVNCSCMATPDFQAMHASSGCTDVVNRFAGRTQTEDSE